MNDTTKYLRIGYFKLLGIAILLVVVFLRGVFPYLIELYEEKGAPISKFIVILIDSASTFNPVWWVFAAIGIGCFFIPIQTEDNGENRLLRNLFCVLMLVVLLFLICVCLVPMIDILNSLSGGAGKKK